MPRASVAAALVLLAAAPAARAESRREAQRQLVGDYLAEARRGVARCRGQLEVVQEFALTPHGSDEPVESALLHLDLASAYLVAAEPGLFAALDPGPRPPEDFARRLREALALLRARAPDLADVYRRVPVRPAPLPGVTVGLFRSRPREVLVRGYFALNPPSAELLAALLAHEATHALQFPEDGSPPAGTKEEREFEAQRREALVWMELGAGPERDFWGVEGDRAGLLARGDAALRDKTPADEAPEWTWVAPADRPRPAPGREAPSFSTETVDAAETVRLIERFGAGLRADRVAAALDGLAAARESLSDLTEVAAPYPKIVNADLMKVWALHPRQHPEAMVRVFEALAPTLEELEKARAALAAPRIGADERALLLHYARDRNVAKAQTAAARAVVERALGRGAPAIACFPYPQARLDDPSAIGLPGAWQCRDGRAEIAAAWAAHVLAHRRQGLAPDAKPTLSQELEAARAALDVWRDIGADAGFDGDHPDRLLRLRIADQASAQALRAYLASLGFADPAPPPPPRARPRRTRKVGR